MATRWPWSRWNSCRIPTKNSFASRIGCGSNCPPPARRSSTSRAPCARTSCTRSVKRPPAPTWRSASTTARRPSWSWAPYAPAAAPSATWPTAVRSRWIRKSRRSWRSPSRRWTSSTWWSPRWTATICATAVPSTLPTASSRSASTARRPASRSWPRISAVAWSRPSRCSARPRRTSSTTTWKPPRACTGWPVRAPTTSGRWSCCAASRRCTRTYRPSPVWWWVLAKPTKR